MEKEAEGPDKRNVSLKILSGLFLFINLTLLAAAIYWMDAVDEHAGLSSVQVSRGMARDEVVSMNGSPVNTTRGAAGIPIDKFKMSDGSALYIFYDEDSRVSSFFSRHY